jgi:YwiC-like protein
MSEIVTDLSALNTARLRAFVLPREHGAWGILLVPLVTGATVALLRGGSLLPILLFLPASLSLFCLRTPAEALLGTAAQRIDNAAERRLVILAVAGYSAVACGALAALLWNGKNSGLLMLGAIAAASFGAQAVLRRLGRATRMVSQIAGLIGLTSTATGAYYVSTGRLDTIALMIWAANWLFAANQVHMVQLRIHNAKVAGFSQRLALGWKFLAGEMLTVALLLVFFHFRLLPKMSVIAFHPMLLRGAAWFFKKPRPLHVHRLGWMELGFALIFGVMFVSGFLR